MGGSLLSKQLLSTRREAIFQALGVQTVAGFFTRDAFIHAAELFQPGTRLTTFAANDRTVHCRRYRARAVVTLFSIPFITKDGGGGGCAMVEDLVVGSERITALQFSGGSWPDRLQGFNRFGMIQEEVREELGKVVESAYVSFMTSSPEKISDEGWRVFTDHSPALNLTVARGVASNTGYRADVRHVVAPPRSNYMDCPKLIGDFRENFHVRGPQNKGVTEYSTFLHSVRQAMRTGNTTRIFMHHGKFYELRTTRSNVGSTALLTGHIVDMETRGQSEFRVWFDPGDQACLPKQIEFRPKSFLRLIFETDTNALCPALQPLTSQENA